MTSSCSSSIFMLLNLYSIISYLWEKKICNIFFCLNVNPFGYNSSLKCSKTYIIDKLVFIIEKDKKKEQQKIHRILFYYSFLFHFAEYQKNKTLLCSKRAHEVVQNIPMFWRDCTSPTSTFTIFTRCFSSVMLNGISLAGFIIHTIL